MIKFVWGPLSWLTLFAILRDSPFRHVGQVIVCTAHLFGVALYYGTNWGDYRASGVSYSRPEVLYYWVYYAGFNAPWVVVPVGMFIDESSIRSIYICSRSHTYTYIHDSISTYVYKYASMDLTWCHRTFSLTSPLVLLLDSSKNIAKAFRALHEQQSTHKTQ